MRGTTFVELLVALAIVLVVTAGVARAMREVAIEAAVLPASADLVQRLRSVRLTLEAELLHAGSGPTRSYTASSGSPRCVSGLPCMSQSV